MKTKGTKGGTETSQGKTLEEKKAATRELRRQRREERALTQMLEWQHKRKLMSQVRICGLIQVAHHNLDVLTRAVAFPGYYLDAMEGKQKAKQAANDLDHVLNSLECDLSEVAKEQGLA
jgi:hypothetical protein